MKPPESSRPAGARADHDATAAACSPRDTERVDPATSALSDDALAFGDEGPTRLDAAGEIGEALPPHPVPLPTGAPGFSLATSAFLNRDLDLALNRTSSAARVRLRARSRLSTARLAVGLALTQWQCSGGETPISNSIKSPTATVLRSGEESRPMSATSRSVSSCRASSSTWPSSITPRSDASSR